MELSEKEAVVRHELKSLLVSHSLPETGRCVMKNCLCTRPSVVFFVHAPVLCSLYTPQCCVLCTRPSVVFFVHAPVLCSLYTPQCCVLCTRPSVVFFVHAPVLCSLYTPQCCVLCTCPSVVFFVHAPVLCSLYTPQCCVLCTRPSVVFFVHAPVAALCSLYTPQCCVLCTRPSVVFFVHAPVLCSLYTPQCCVLCTRPSGCVVFFVHAPVAALCSLYTPQCFVLCTHPSGCVVFFVHAPVLCSLYTPQWLRCVLCTRPSGCVVFFVHAPVLCSLYTPQWMRFVLCTRPSVVFFVHAPVLCSLYTPQCCVLCTRPSGCVVFFVHAPVLCSLYTPQCCVLCTRPSVVFFVHAPVLCSLYTPQCCVLCTRPSVVFFVHAPVLCSLYTPHVFGADDEIVLSYVLGVLECLAPGDDLDEAEDVYPFADTMVAYLPGFSAVRLHDVGDWMVSTAVKLSQPLQHTDVNGTSSQRQDKDPSSPGAEASGEKGMDGVPGSDTDSMNALRELCPAAITAELHHCLHMSQGNVEEAAHLLLSRQEAGSAITKTAEVKACKKNSKTGRGIHNDESLKDSILAKYSFVDTSEDKTEHRPELFVKDQKKMIRYREGQVVSTKGERFSEIKKPEGDDMKKTYVSLKPQRKYRFH
ncbi:hypothetical protein ACOMHN_007961 [Nucella lapillus]